MIAANLTTIEVSNLDKTSTIALIPYGSFEQHGPYLPLNTDTIIAEEVAKRIEQQFPDSVLLYPALWIGDSAEHEGFDGTLSLDVYTSMKMLEQIFTWLAKSGFTKCLLYNAHGGNRHLGAAICEEFSRKSTLKIKSFFGFNTAVDAKATELFGGNESHAGSVETSLVYYFRPDLRKIKDPIIKNIELYPGGFAFHQTRKLSTSGILNFDTKIMIDVDKAQILADVLVTEGIKQIEKLKKLEIR